MKRILLILLLLPMLASAQVPTGGFAFWKDSGPTFSPADIDSLAHWYVASDILDSLGKSSGDTTYIWPDRWSPAGSLYSTTDSQKPTILSDSNTVVFDAADDLMNVDFADLAQPNTVFMVFRTHRIDVPKFHMDGFDVAGRHALYQNGSPALPIMFSGANGPTGRGLTADTIYIFSLRYNGASSEMRQNGLTYTGNAGTQGMSGIRMNTNSAGAPGTGQAAGYREIIVYSGLLSGEEVAQVESYLATKYGITLP